MGLKSCHKCALGQALLNHIALFYVHKGSHADCAGINAVFEEDEDGHCCLAAANENSEMGHEATQLHRNREPQFLLCIQ